MRRAALALLIGLCACTATQTAGPSTTETLTPSDAATTLVAGGPITMTVQTPTASQGGEDPLVLMSLKAADGRVMGFEELNHAPEHVMAQSAGGPLAQAMGLTAGDETPKLYGARASDNHGAAFLCGPDGPVSIGYYEARDGTVTMIGMKSNITFETLSDGQQHPVPFSPDQICARLHFRRS
ncbi:MAG: hypothetical protein QM759_12710 [Terricaulis sp.]